MAWFSSAVQTTVTLDPSRPSGLIGSLVRVTDTGCVTAGVKNSDDQYREKTIKDGNFCTVFNSPRSIVRFIIRLNGQLYTLTVHEYCPASDSLSGEKEISGLPSDNGVSPFIHVYVRGVSIPKTLQVRL